MENSMNVEEILVHGTEEQLNELKAFLFRENIRLDIERQQLEERERQLAEFEKDLERRKEEFIKEKATFRDETNQMNHRLISERQKLTQDTLFFDKKMEILKSGFADLEADRQKFKREKEAFYRKMEESAKNYSSFKSDYGSAFFKGVNNLLALKKRYRDLCKIFHPDNLAGDNQMFRLITEEYERLAEEFNRRVAY